MVQVPHESDDCNMDRIRGVGVWGGAESTIQRLENTKEEKQAFGISVVRDTLVNIEKS